MFVQVCIVFVPLESDAGMLSCQAVTIGRDVRGLASLAWGGVHSMGGNWSVIDHTTQPLPTPPLSPPCTCPSSMLNYKLTV